MERWNDWLGPVSPDLSVMSDERVHEIMRATTDDHLASECSMELLAREERTRDGRYNGHFEVHGRSVKIYCSESRVQEMYDRFEAAGFEPLVYWSVPS